MWQEIDFAEPTTSRDRKLEVLIDIRRQQQLLLGQRRHEYVNFAVFNGIFFALIVCLTLIFDSFFNTEITFKHPHNNVAEELVQDQGGKNHG